MTRDVDSRKFLSGYFLLFVKGAISWQFKLQQCVVMSITKIKYIANTKVAKKKKYIVDEEFLTRNRCETRQLNCVL